MMKAVSCAGQVSGRVPPDSDVDVHVELVHEQSDLRGDEQTLPLWLQEDRLFLQLQTHPQPLPHLTLTINP